MRLLLVLALLLAGALVACDGGSTEYEVSVRFNTAVTQEDIDEVGDVLGSYDDDLDFLIQESFPPTGVARLETGVPNFCRTVEVELAGRSYVDGMDCGRR